MGRRSLGETAELTRDGAVVVPDAASRISTGKDLDAGIVIG